MFTASNRYFILVFLGLTVMFAPSAVIVKLLALGATTSVVNYLTATLPLDMYEALRSNATR